MTAGSANRPRARLIATTHYTYTTVEPLYNGPDVMHYSKNLDITNEFVFSFSPRLFIYLNISKYISESKYNERRHNEFSEPRYNEFKITLFVYAHIYLNHGIADITNSPRNHVITNLKLPFMSTHVYI